jgi:hypothetical protein
VPAVLAHQGGWDEILLIVGPILVVVGLLRLLKKRVERNAATTAPNDTAPNDTAPNDTAPNDTAPNDTSPNGTGEPAPTTSGD